MPRKPLAALAASVSALAVAGFALAHGGGPGSVQAASATFDAATVADLHSGTCTGADGTYTKTKATYAGNSTSSDARLDGTLTVKARTFYNSTTNLGVVQGWFRVENADGHTDGKFVAVDTNGSLDGYVVGGRWHGSHAGLLGSLSATFDPATGFNGGQLGTGSSDNTAVFVSGHCGGDDEQGSGDGQNHQKHHQHGKHGKHKRNGKR